MTVGALLAFAALVFVPQVASANWTTDSSAVSTFTAVGIPQPPGNVTATLTCQPDSSTVEIAWVPSGWEDGFTVEIYKAVGKKLHLIETHDRPASATGLTLDLTGWPSGRYVVIVSGYDDTQTLTGLQATFQKTGSCA